jgi:FKBP-type peptidyl-prolyl cis-trans isomerase
LKIFVPLALGLCLIAGVAAAQTPPTSAPAAPAESGPAFLAKNAQDPAVKSLPSGLQYRVVRSGAADAPSPKLGDVIKVHYEGKLLDGQVFDSTFERNRAVIMPLGALIPAWVEALPLMRVGDEWILYAPPELGYGAEGAGPIPPNSVLVFRLQLLGMLSAD